MPVLISAFPREVPLVRALAERLLQDGGEVRAYLQEDDHDLRQMGAKLAVGALNDELNLEAALTNVHTFMPLLPDPQALRAEGLESLALAFTGSAAGAAADARISQTILVVGTPSDPLTAQVEEGFRSRCSPLCVLHLTGDETQDELVAVLASIDDHEDVDGEYDLTSARASFMG